MDQEENIQTLDHHNEKLGFKKDYCLDQTKLQV